MIRKWQRFQLEASRTCSLYQLISCKSYWPSYQHSLALLVPVHSTSSSLVRVTGPHTSTLWLFSYLFTLPAHLLQELLALIPALFGSSRTCSLYQLISCKSYWPSHQHSLALLVPVHSTSSSLVRVTGPHTSTLWLFSYLFTLPAHLLQELLALIPALFGSSRTCSLYQLISCKSYWPSLALLVPVHSTSSSLVRVTGPHTSTLWLFSYLYTLPAHLLQELLALIPALFGSPVHSTSSSLARVTGPHTSTLWLFSYLFTLPAHLL